MTTSEKRHVSVGVLCIQGAFIEHVKMLEREAGERQGLVGVAVRDVRRPSQLADLDGLVVPGGESTTLSLFLGQGGFEPALRSLVAAGKCVWGTCAGLILLSGELDSQKNGGQITVRWLSHSFCVSL